MRISASVGSTLVSGMAGIPGLGRELCQHY
jgi:hypothetical protein